MQYEWVVLQISKATKGTPQPLNAVYNNLFNNDFVMVRILR